MAKSLERYRAAERRVWETVGAEPTERRVRLASGAEMRVQETGDGPPIVFIHGVSVAGTTWAPLMARLSDFRCIALDRPGCGLSDPLPTPPQTIGEVEGYADRFLGDALDALGLESAHLGATSYGGYFALRGAAACPERVDRHVEYSFPLGARFEKVPLSARIAALPGMQSLPARLPMTRRMAKVALTQFGLRRAIETGRFSDEMLDWFVTLQRETDSMRNDMRASPQLITFRDGQNEAALLSDELLAGVRSPTLFLWGDEDPNGGERTARAFVPRIPGARLEMLVEAGHAPWIDEPDLCATRTRAFLEERPDEAT